MASDRRRWDANDGLTTVELEAAAAPSSARSATASSHMPYRIGGDRFAGGVDCPPAWPVLAMSNHPSYPAWPPAGPPAGPPEPRERGRRGLREHGRVIAAESKPAMTLALLQNWWQGGYRTQAEHGQPPGPDAAPTYLRLSYGSEPVGRLVLAEPGRRVELAPADRRLLGDLARQVGVAAHSIQAGEEAARLSVDLQRSLERLVLAREEERRRIGRDLHDGLGPCSPG